MAINWSHYPLIIHYFDILSTILPVLKVVNFLRVDHGKMMQESWKIMEKSWNLIPEKRWEPCYLPRFVVDNKQGGSVFY